MQYTQFMSLDFISDLEFECFARLDNLIAWCHCLQPGEVALTVPKSLVVTLEKVLGDETIGMNVC